MVLNKTTQKMKKYNLFCVSINETTCNATISGPVTSDPLSRREIFDNLFQIYLPQLKDRLSEHFPQSSILLSIDRCFFSSFNKFFYFHEYGARLSYLCKKFHILSDKLPVSRITYTSPDFDNNEFSFIFFVKEFCDE